MAACIPTLRPLFDPKIRASQTKKIRSRLEKWSAFNRGDTYFEMQVLGTAGNYPSHLNPAVLAGNRTHVEATSRSAMQRSGSNAIQHHSGESQYKRDFEGGISKTTEFSVSSV